MDNPPPPPPDDWEEDTGPAHFGRFQKARGPHLQPHATVGYDPHELDSILVNDHDYLTTASAPFNFDPYQRQQNLAHHVPEPAYHVCGRPIVAAIWLTRCVLNGCRGGPRWSMVGGAKRGQARLASPRLASPPFPSLAHAAFSCSPQRSPISPTSSTRCRSSCQSRNSSVTSCRRHRVTHRRRAKSTGRMSRRAPHPQSEQTSNKCGCDCLALLRLPADGATAASFRASLNSSRLFGLVATYCAALHRVALRCNVATCRTVQLHTPGRKSSLAELLNEDEMEMCHLYLAHRSLAARAWPTKLSCVAHSAYAVSMLHVARRSVACCHWGSIRFSTDRAIPKRFTACPRVRVQPARGSYLSHCRISPLSRVTPV
jgi:hypothetical protein